MKLIAKAKIQVTIEVYSGTWGSDCRIDQLYKQSMDEAIGKVNNLIQKSGSEAKIIGMPKVIGVITEEVP